MLEGGGGVGLEMTSASSRDALWRPNQPTILAFLKPDTQNLGALVS